MRVLPFDLCAANESTATNGSPDHVNPSIEQGGIRRAVSSRFAILLAMACLAPAATAAGPRPEFPRDWVVVASVRSPQQTLAQANRLLGMLNLRWAPTEQLERFDLAELGLNTGEIHFGIAGANKDLDSLYFFALTPTPLAVLSDALDGDSAGDIALFSLRGYEFAATRRDDWTLILPAAQHGLLEQPLEPSPALDASAEASLRVSSAGIRWLQSRTKARPPSDSRTLLALNRLEWPPSKAWLDAAVVTNRPLMECVSEQFGQASIGLSLANDGGVTVSLAARLLTPADPAAASARARRPQLARQERLPIVTASGDALSGGLPQLARLLLAYSEGRPDVVEAPEYPAQLYEPFEQELLAAVQEVRWFDARLLSRKPRDPFESNRVAVLRVSDESAFIDSAVRATESWNAMLDKIDARTRLTVAIDRERLLDQALPEGVRFTTDVAAAIENPPSPETREIAARHYGRGGNYVLRLVPLGDGVVLLGDLEEEQVRAAALKLSHAQPEGGALRGAAHVDRYAAWRNAVLTNYMQDAIGFKPPAPLGQSPMNFEMSLRDDLWRLKLTAPKNTVKAFGEYWTHTKMNRQRAE